MLLKFTDRLRYINHLHCKSYSYNIIKVLLCKQKERIVYTVWGLTTVYQTHGEKKSSYIQL